jgi:hypothetical protein
MTNSQLFMLVLPLYAIAAYVAIIAYYLGQLAAAF